jgi:hypothetical protein
MHGGGDLSLSDFEKEDLIPNLLDLTERKRQAITLLHQETFVN